MFLLRIKTRVFQYREKILNSGKEPINEVNGESIQYSFTRVSKFHVSCIRVLVAVIVVHVFSCINKVYYFFVYEFSCTNNCFIFPCMYFRVSIYILFFLVYFVYFSCIDVKKYFVLSAIYYIQSLKSQFRQKF